MNDGEDDRPRASEKNILSIWEGSALTKIWCTRTWSRSIQYYDCSWLLKLEGAQILLAEDGRIVAINRSPRIKFSTNVVNEHKAKS